MKKIVLLVCCLFALNAFSIDIVNCSAENENLISTAHEQAYEYLLLAWNRIQNTHDSVVMKGFADIYRIDVFNPNHQWMIERVKSKLLKYVLYANDTVYKCGNHIGWCYTEPLAIVPPPKRRIHLCSGWFDRPYYKQVGTLIHEWNHRWGGWNMKYAFEKYCYDWDGMGPEKIIKQPDAYMLFVYFLATQGVGIPCFKK